MFTTSQLIFNIIRFEYIGRITLITETFEPDSQERDELKEKQENLEI
jgi:hypothetical protein